MVEIRLSNVAEMLEHSMKLFEDHWDEIALNKDLMALKPDEARYYAMEKEGKVLILAAWDGDELVGYSVNFLVNHLHYADLNLCSNDLLFVSKEHRQSRTGLKLMKETEIKAKGVGAELMLWHAKPDTALSAMLPRLKYNVQDIIYSKEL
jgi:predicted GNAT superfamily acetyltransferase